MRLHTSAAYEPSHQMPIDGPQPVDAGLPPKLVEHPGGRQHAAQPGEVPPGGLLRQLGHHQIERMRGRQHCQQMRAPQLRCTQGMSPTARKVTRTDLANEVIGNVRTHQFKQVVGAHRR
jgi:hypothetical protein